MEFVAELIRILTALRDHRVDYVLVGGAALNVHGLVRATQDIDIFIRPTEDNVASLKAALRALWDDPYIDEISAQDLCGDYPAVRYGPPVGEIFIDILTRLGEATRYEDLVFEEVQVAQTMVRVATPATLYRMKKNTLRPIDRADAQALRQLFLLSDDDAR